MNIFNDGIQERLACTGYGLFTNMKCEMYQKYSKLTKSNSDHKVA